MSTHSASVAIRYWRDSPGLSSMPTSGRALVRRFRTASLAVTIMAAALVGCGSPGRSDQYPSMPIELVVPFPAGGGSDNLARMIQTIAARDGLVSQSINVVNRSGGAGAVGLAYVAGKRGDTHTLMTAIDTLLAVPLQYGYAGPTHRDLTLVAVLALDDMLVVVPAASPFTTIDELVAHARAHPGRLKLATNAAGGEDHIFGGLIESASGARFSYVHTRGGAEAMQNVVGGHVDLAVPNPSETLSLLEGGLVRALAVGSSERLAILPEVPTLEERGIVVHYRMFRGIALPADVPADVVQYWERLLRRVTESDRWAADYLEKLALTPQFLAGDEARRFFEQTEQLYRTTLRMLGVI